MDIENKVVSELVDDNISIKFYVQNTLITYIDDFISIVIWLHHICMCEYPYENKRFIQWEVKKMKALGD